MTLEVTSIIWLFLNKFMQVLSIVKLLAQRGYVSLERESLPVGESRPPSRLVVGASTIDRKGVDVGRGDLSGTPTASAQEMRQLATQRPTARLNSVGKATL